MNRIVVVYESKYGYTKRYAEWLGEALSCPVFERKAFRPRNLSKYETVIYGGGIYAGVISGIQFLRRNETLLSEKKVLLFTCGLADPDNPDNISNIRSFVEKAFSGKIPEQIRLFHLRGGMDYSRLTFVHRSMMSILRKMLLKKADSERSWEGRQILETYGQCLDFTDRKSIRPLVEYTGCKSSFCGSHFRSLRAPQ